MLNIPTLEQLLKLNNKLETVFWDMDGTLINTEVLHEQAIAIYLQMHSGNVVAKDPSKLVHSFKGQTDHIVYLGLLKKNYIEKCEEFEFIEKKDAIFERLLDETPSSSLIDLEIRQLLSDMYNEEIKLILVTSSERKIAHLLLKELDLEKYFIHIITREDTQKNKPHPAPYDRALELSKADKKRCLVFEDSKVGLTSAQAAEIGTIIQADWY